MPRAKVRNITLLGRASDGIRRERLKRAATRGIPTFMQGVAAAFLAAGVGAALLVRGMYWEAFGYAVLAVALGMTVFSPQNVAGLGTDPTQKPAVTRLGLPFTGWGWMRVGGRAAVVRRVLWFAVLAPLALPAASQAAGSVYVTDLNGHSVSQYTINPETGALSPKTPATVPAPEEAWWIAVTPDFKNAYVTTPSFAGSVYEYTIDPQTGGLSPKTLRASSRTGRPRSR